MHEAGGPEVLRVEDVWVPDPGATEVRIAQKAVGLNFLDTYQRRGLFPSPGLPWVIGFEGAGIVESVGGAVTAAQGRRPRRLRERAARCLCGAPHHRGGRRGQAARRHRLRAGRRHHAQGHDGGISGSQERQGAAGRHRAGPCRRRRYRPAALPVARASRRHRHRLRRGRRQAQRSPRVTGAATPSTTGGRMSPPASPTSRAARALPWSTIPSAATRPRPPSPAFAPAARSCFTAARRAPSLSMSSRQRRINPSRSCAPASSRRTTHPPRSRRVPVRSSRWLESGAVDARISAGAMRSPMRQRRIATSKRGAPPARAF